MTFKEKVEEIYVSTDIESNGPIPGIYSMLGFGSAAFRSDGQLIDSFEANLLPIEGANEHPDTMAWWQTQGEAWEYLQENRQDPTVAMLKYLEWLKALPGTPVFVGYPAGFDFLFIYWYLIRFTGESPFSFSALDIKSYACAVLGTPYKATTKKRMPQKWFSKRKHTHKGIDDAIEQGELFINMREDNITKYIKG